MSIRLYEFEFVGTNLKTGETKIFKAVSTWMYGAYDKLVSQYGREWKFKY